MYLKIRLLTQGKKYYKEVLQAGKEGKRHQANKLLTFQGL